MPSALRLYFPACIFQACHHCLKEHTDDIPLMKCSGCNRVVYDSLECQRADRKTHKRLCAVYRAVAAAVRAQVPAPATPLADFAALNRRVDLRARAMRAALEARLGPLSQHEMGLVYYEPRCLACARTAEDVGAAGAPGGDAVAPLLSCEQCHMSFYCSEAHRAFAEHTHRTVPDPDTPDGLPQCAAHQQIRADWARLRGCGDGGLLRPTLDRAKARWQSLRGRTWEDEYGALKDALLKPAAGGALRAATGALAYPMTVLWAMESVSVSEAWTRKPTLRVDILGACEEEVMASATHIEEILHHLPEVETLIVTLCGPEVPARLQLPDGVAGGMPLCPTCRQRGRKYMRAIVTGSYADYIARRGALYTAPDLAVAFRPDLSTSLHDTWLPTIRALVRHKVPTLFTTDSEGEVQPARAALALGGAPLLPGVRGRNPWGCAELLVEPCAVKGFYAPNGYIAGAFVG